MDEVEVLDINPCYVKVKYPSGKEDNVSLKYVAPINNTKEHDTDHTDLINTMCSPNLPIAEPEQVSTNMSLNNDDLNKQGCVANDSKLADLFNSDDDNEEFLGFRRSARIKNQEPVQYKE